MDTNTKAAGPSGAPEQHAPNGGKLKKGEARKEDPGRVEAPSKATPSPLHTGKTEQHSTSPEAKGVPDVPSSDTLPALDIKSKSHKAKEHGHHPPDSHHVSDQVPESDVSSGVHQRSSIGKSSYLKRQKSKLAAASARLGKGKRKHSQTSPKSNIADTSNEGHDARINTEAVKADVKTEGKTGEQPERPIGTKADDEVDDGAPKSRLKASVKVVSPQATSPNPNAGRTSVESAMPSTSKVSRTARTMAERRRQSNLEAEQRSMFYSTLKDLATTLRTESGVPLDVNQTTLTVRNLQYNIGWAIGAAIVLVVTVALLLWIRNYERPLVRGACVSRACLQHASAFKDLLNYDVDPCVDLHAFVCSKEPTKEPGGGRDAVNFIAHLIKKHRLELVKLFVDGSTNFAASKMATDFLQECTRINKSPVNVESLIHFFEFADVPWPFDQSSTRELHPLVTALTLTLKWGINTWFRAYTSIVYKAASPSSEKPVLFIEPSSQPSLWLDFVRTVGDRRQVYFEQVHKLYNASLPDGKRRERMLSTEMGVLSILGAARSPGTMPRPAVTTIARLAVITRNATAQNWLEAMEAASNGQDVDETTEVSVQDVRILRAVDKLLFIYSEDALSEHLSWWLVQILTVIGRPQGYYVIAGSQEAATVDISVECFRMLAVRFGLLLVSESAVQFFTQESRRMLEAFLTNLLVFMGGIVYKVPWLRNDIKATVEDRLASVKVALWPPFVETSNSTLWKLYSSFCVTCKRDDGNPGDAHLTGPTTTTRHPELLDMWWHASTRFWTMSSWESEYMQLLWQGDGLDAFLYEPMRHQMRVAHAALRSPLFYPASAELRQANYGGLGATFIASVLRMFTKQDAEIDAKVFPDPWTNISGLVTQRAKSLNCSQEFLSHLHHIAALGLAWQALKNMTASVLGIDSGQLSSDTGLFIGDGDEKHYYSGDQLFFLTYCLSRCEADVRLHHSHYHGCNAAVRGVRDFGSVFQCKNGMPMVPHKACDISDLF